MSFFEPPAPPPEEEPRERPRQPVWSGASDGELGAPVAVGPIMLARTDTVAVAVNDLLAYRHGLEFVLSVRTPHGSAHDWDAHSLMQHGRRRASDGEIDPEVLRFGVQFADGRKVTNLGSPFGGLVPRGGQNVLQVSASSSDRMDEPINPVLMSRGGGGSSGRYDQRYWLWPLPSDGALTFVCEWPSKQIELTRVELDSAPILEAARRAIILWDDETTA